MTVDILVFISLVLFCYLGYRRGAFISILGLITLLCAYLAAYLFSRPLGLFFEIMLDLSGIVAYATGGMTAFIVIFILGTICIMIIDWWRRKETKQAGKNGLSAPDKWIGAVLGGIIGFFLLAIVLWTFNLARVSPIGEGLPDISQSISGRLSSTAVQKGTFLLAQRIMDDEQQARIVSQAVSNPASSVKEMKMILDHPKVQTLSHDKEFHDAVLSGDKYLLFANPALDSVMSDPVIIAQARELGMISPDESPGDIKMKTAESLARIGKRFDKIKNDPEIKKVLQNADIQEKLARSDIAWLLMDSRFLKLVDRVVEVSDMEDQQEVK